MAKKNNAKFVIEIIAIIMAIALVGALLSMIFTNIGMTDEVPDDTPGISQPKDDTPTPDDSVSGDDDNPSTGDEDNQIAESTAVFTNGKAFSFFNDIEGNRLCLDREDETVTAALKSYVSGYITAHPDEEEQMLVLAVFANEQNAVLDSTNASSEHFNAIYILLRFTGEDDIEISFAGSFSSDAILLSANEDAINCLKADNSIGLDDFYTKDHEVYYFVDKEYVSEDALPLEFVSDEVVSLLFTSK